MSDLTEILYILIYVAICLGASLAYWINNQSVKVTQRVLISMHGVMMLTLYGTALLISHFKLSSFDYMGIYSAFCVLPLVSMLFSCIKHRGNKYLHLLHIIMLPALMWTWVIGGMYITGDSL